MTGRSRVVLGSGFERRTELVDEIARHFPLAGNSGAAIRRVKDPQSLAADCAELGIPHPAFRWDPPPDPENWVVKTAGGAGGSHVRRANGDAPASGRYFQRFVSGRASRPCSSATAASARIVGFSRQWTSPAPDAPYRYGGAVRLRRIDRRGCGGDRRLAFNGLARRAGLVGLCSADFIRDADGYQLIEINPRPGATLDIFDSAEAPLMEAHLRAASGEAYTSCRVSPNSMASMIAYASAPVAHFPAYRLARLDRRPSVARHKAGRRRSGLHGLRPRPERRGDPKSRARRRRRQLQRCWEGDRDMKDGSAFLNDNAQRIVDEHGRRRRTAAHRRFQGAVGRKADRRRRQGLGRHRGGTAHGGSRDGRPRQHFGGAWTARWRNGLSRVEVRSSQPVLACLASQYAGWNLSSERLFRHGIRAGAGARPGRAAVRDS